MRMRTAIWTAASVMVAGATLAAPAHAQQDFYKGKSISLVIGYSVGGGYDLYARVLAKHLTRHIPGNPTVVPQNMPGAGSMKAMEYLLTVAPKDGTAIGTFGRTIPMAPLLEGAKFDPQKLEWIGSITSDTSVCITSHNSKIKTWNDAKTSQFTAGGEGKGSDPDVVATMIKNVFNLNVKLVSGYPGTADIMLAMERGEVDGLCGISYSTLRARHLELLNQKKINIIVQAALKKDAALPDVPLMLDLAADQRQHQMLELLLAAQTIARPFAMPPGSPADRVAIIRAAFDKTVKDPEFLAETKQANLDVNPADGAQIAALLKELYATPADVVKAASTAIGN